MHLNNRERSKERLHWQQFIWYDRTMYNYTFEYFSGACSIPCALHSREYKKANIIVLQPPTCGSISHKRRGKGEKLTSL